MLNNIEENLISRIPDNAISFFIIFSRFEYALKRNGFLKNKDVAEVNWDSFVQNLGPGFLKTIQSSGQANTILKSPPNKQMVEHGKLVWKSTREIENANDLFVAVCRVRNNLFHGGKFAEGPINGSEGDHVILKEAIKIIEMALIAKPEIKNFFDEIVT